MSHFKEENEDSSSIIPKKCIRPKFIGQAVIESPGFYPLDTENSIIFFHSILSPAERSAYIDKALLIPRTSGRSGFGLKPRKEMCYSPSGNPYVYSRVAHPTMKYPAHCLELLQKCIGIVHEKIREETGTDCPYSQIDSGVDILYDSTFPRGGSICAHKDDEDESWGMVVIYSLGQSRYLRVRSDESKEFTNVFVCDNSLVVMYGPTFQKKYTHQVDKLYDRDEVGARLSLNARIKKYK